MLLVLEWANAFFLFELQVAGGAELAELRQQLQHAASNAAILSQYHDKLFSTLGAEFVLAVKHIAALEACSCKLIHDSILIHSTFQSIIHFIPMLAERHHQRGRYAARAARLCASRYGRTTAAAAHAAHGQ